MKKAAILPLLLVFILCGCSVQERIIPEVLLERLSKNDCGFEFDASDGFYSEGKYYCFANEKDVLLSASCDENNIIYELSVYSPAVEYGIEKLFIDAAGCFSGEDIQSVFTELKKSASEFPAERETKGFVYTYFKSENGLFFSVRNKRIKQIPQPELTLRENETIRK